MAPRTCVAILFLLNLPFLLYLFELVIFAIYLVSCGIALEHFRLSTIELYCNLFLIMTPAFILNHVVKASTKREVFVAGPSHFDLNII